MTIRVLKKQGKTIRTIARETLKAFIATLGNSRAGYVYFYDNERTAHMDKGSSLWC
jgi:hypothetical protein